MGPFARIIMRYLAGALVAKGILDPTIGGTLASDPDILMAVEVVLGLIVGAVSEFSYARAKKTGGPT